MDRLRAFVPTLAVLFVVISGGCAQRTPETKPTPLPTPSAIVELEKIIDEVNASTRATEARMVAAKIERLAIVANALAGESVQAAERPTLTFDGFNSEWNVMPDIIRGARIASYDLTARGEDVGVSTLVLAPARTGAPIRNLRVSVNGKRFGVVYPEVANGMLYAFSAIEFTAPEGGFVTVDVYAEILPSATPGLKSTLVSLIGCEARGVKSGAFVKCTPPPPFPR